MNPLFSSTHDVTVNWARDLWNASSLAENPDRIDTPVPEYLHHNLTTVPPAEEEEEYLERRLLHNIRSTAVLIYLFTCLFGVVGNTLVIVVILRYRKIRDKSVSNYYILNLAFADELHLFTLPLFCYATYRRNWIFGDAACRMAHALRECNKFASVYTLVALSVDRCLATFHCLGHLRRITVGVIVCLAIWIVCMAGCAPYLVHSRVRHRSDGTLSCQFDWAVLRTVGARRLWVYLQMVVGVLVPLSAIASFNALLVRRLMGIRARRCSMDRSGAQSRFRSGTTKLVVVIVVVFVVSHMPYHVIEVVSLRTYEIFVFEGLVPGPRYRTAFIYANTTAQVLAFLSSCCNPIIYGVINKNYRKHNIFHPSPPPTKKLSPDP